MAVESWEGAAAMWNLRQNGYLEAIFRQCGGTVTAMIFLVVI
jgi:hypothetical protein